MFGNLLLLFTGVVMLDWGLSWAGREPLWKSLVGVLAVLAAGWHLLYVLLRIIAALI